MIKRADYTLILASFFLLILSFNSVYALECVEEELPFMDIYQDLDNNNITSNLENVSCSNIESFPNLIFENFDYGAIVFLNPLNLSSQETQIFLSNLDDYLTFSEGNISLYSSGTVFENQEALIAFYNLANYFSEQGFSSSSTSQEILSKLVVSNSSNSFISRENIIDLNSVEFNSELGIFSFNASNFSTLTFDFNSPTLFLSYPLDESQEGLNLDKFSFFLYDYGASTCNLHLSSDASINISTVLNFNDSQGNVENYVSLPSYLESGQYFWNISCTDYANNFATSETNTFYLDINSPYIQSVSSDGYLYIMDSGSSIEIQIEFSELISNPPLILINYEEQFASDCTQDQNYSVFCFNFQIPQQVEESITISISGATDFSNNEMGLDEEHFILVDTKAPHIDFYDLEYINIDNSEDYYVGGSCIAEEGATFNLSINGEHYNNLSCVSDGSDEGWEISINTSLLNEGYIEFGIDSFDIHDNILSIAQTTTKDTIAPQFFNYTQYYNIEATDIQGTGVTFENLYALDNGNTVYYECEYESDTFTIGEFNQTCIAYDSAGNSESISFIMHVKDTLAPSIYLQPISEIFTTSTINVSFYVNETVSGINNCIYELDDINYSISNCEYENEFSITSLSEGVHKIRFFATDNSMNLGSTQYTSFFTNTQSRNVSVPTENNISINSTTEVILYSLNSSINNIIIPISVNQSKNISIDLGLFSSKNSTTSKVTLQDNLSVQRNSNIINVSLNIFENTSIYSSSNWSGEFLLPVIKPNNSFSPIPSTGFVISGVNSIIELGLPNQTLNFDKAIRIVFNGQANITIAYQNSTTFKKITSVCAYDNISVSDTIPSGGECYINSGSDLIVWTKHLTLFTTYSESAIPPSTPSSGSSRGGGGGGGGGGGSSTTSTNLTSNNSTSANQSNQSNQTVTNPNNTSTTDNSQRNTNSNGNRRVSRITGAVIGAIDKPSIAISSSIVLILLAGYLSVKLIRRRADVNYLKNL